MKKITFIVLALVCSYLSQAQRIDRQIIAGGGGIALSSTAQLSFTIGETTIQYLSATGASLSQGFQQADNNTTGIRSPNRMDVQLSIYPNPFIQNLEVKSDRKLSRPTFSMVDIAGRMVQISTEEVDNGKHWRIQVDNLPAGNYWLTIVANDYENTIPLHHTKL